MSKNKKRILRYIFTTALIFISSQTVFSSTDNDGLNASVEINAIFNVAIAPSSISFGNVDPGDSTDVKNVQLTAVSNNNRRWSIQMNYASPLTADTYTIPNDSFRWWADTSGSGQVIGSPGHMDTAPFVFYSAGSNEYVTEQPVNINLHFQVDVPQYQARGSYKTVIVFTMYED